MSAAGPAAAAAARSGDDAALLARVPLFANLRAAHLSALVAACQAVRVPGGEVLCTAGRPSPGLVVLRRGRALRAGAELGAGDWFDETDALDVRLAQHTVTAAEEVECLVLPARALHGALRADPELGVALVREISRHVVPSGDDAGQLLRYAEDLRETFREGERRQEALKLSVMGAVRALVALGESKDPRSAGHAARAARTARALARELGDDEEQVGHAAVGGLLHDLGNIALDPVVLSKPGPLSPEELAQVRSHPEIGARILEHIDFLRPVVPYVLHHHERFDGRGYPRGLSGRAIPREGRLMAAVEACETLRAVAGPRRSPPGPGALIAELRAEAGRQLDREMVVALCRLLEAGTLDDG
ncbi:MAG TPA: HD domain-containing phosphohydrolase [Chloroflexota bacterium]|nr:HD domain-containing phosphohydrolase [Chloroflexota bacterium]